MTERLRKGRRFIGVLAAGLLAVPFLLWGTARLLPAPPLLEGVPFSRVVTDRHGNLLRVTLAQDEQIRIFTPLEDVSPALVHALLLYEDRYFYRHPGVNLPALVRAAWTSATGRRAVGASTVTMQTARMRLGLETTTIPGKLAQIFWALRYEAHYGKAEILEAYLNLLPYGGNLAGVGAASRFYFGKAPHLLGLSEATALAVVPQNPVARRPGSPAFDSARARFLARASEALAQTPLEALALQSPLRLQNRGFPFRSPHAVDRALRDARHQTESDLSLTVDVRLEDLIRKSLQTYLSRLAPYGIRNGAVMVVDARTQEILAEVGSADYFDASIEGQVNGTQALRSPGSTLKPFLYGLALDQGLIHSETVLLDTPRRFAGYAPENADGTFAGPVGATRALVASRNVPAVHLAGQVQPDLYDFLQKLDVPLPFPREHYGLSIALGGAEVTAAHLTKAYAALAAGGRAEPLKLFRNDPTTGGTPLFSPEAAWIVLTMTGARPERLQLGARVIALPYKTGTSNGLRDAWTAGVVGPYAVTVWFGAFDNTPNPYLLGEKTAAPFWKQLARLLATDPTYGPALAESRPKPEGVVTVDVCAATGDLARGRCAAVKPAWFIPGKSPVRDTGVLQEIWIDTETGLRACRWDAKKTEKKWWEIWPAREAQAFLAAGIVKMPPPPWRSDCRAPASSEGPSWIAPAAGVDFFTGTASRPDRALVVLQGVPASGEGPLFWFDGARPLGVTKKGEPLPVELAVGRHTLAATDLEGRTTVRTVRVRRPQL